MTDTALAEALINMVLLTLLAAITIGIVRVRNLFAVVALTSAYSFTMASVMLVLDGVDVAMTEASVGAGISTVLVLGALYLTRSEERPPSRRNWPALFVAGIAGMFLIWGATALPDFGTADQPMNTHVGAMYLSRNATDTDIPNVVTAVLASYRGFDTLGEVVVVFTAGLGILLLLKRFREAG